MQVRILSESIKLEITMPKLPNTICQACRGTGISSSGTRCVPCNGSGKQTKS